MGVVTSLGSGPVLGVALLRPEHIAEFAEKSCNESLRVQTVLQEMRKESFFGNAAETKEQLPTYAKEARKNLPNRLKAIVAICADQGRIRDIFELLGMTRDETRVEEGKADTPLSTSVEEACATRNNMPVLKAALWVRWGPREEDAEAEAKRHAEVFKPLAEMGFTEAGAVSPPNLYFWYSVDGTVSPPLGLELKQRLFVITDPRVEGSSKEKVDETIANVNQQLNMFEVVDMLKLHGPNFKFMLENVDNQFQKDASDVMEEARSGIKTEAKTKTALVVKCACVYLMFGKLCERLEGEAKIETLCKKEFLQRVQDDFNTDNIDTCSDLRSSKLDLGEKIRTDTDFLGEKGEHLVSWWSEYGDVAVKEIGPAVAREDEALPEKAL